LEIAGYKPDPDISKNHSPIVNLYTLLDTQQALGVKNCYPLDTGLFMLLIPAQHCSLPETIHHKKMNIPHPISLSRRAGPPTLPYRGL
jgi:hypothetical protein